MNLGYSLLDNAPNYLVGCVIQKRLFYPKTKYMDDLLVFFFFILDSTYDMHMVKKRGRFCSTNEHFDTFRGLDEKLFYVLFQPIPPTII